MKNVLEYIESIAEKQNIGQIVDEYQTYSYSKLLEQSQSIGSALTQYFTYGKPVPVFMEKGIDCLSVFLGSVYAGCFYVLLNPELPLQRHHQIIDIL